MKRTFVNQIGDSNKFWTVEQTEMSLIVAWGKVGAEGRTNSKNFSTVNECRKYCIWRMTHTVKKRKPGMNF